MIVTQKILPGGSAKLRWASVVQWKEKTLEVGGPRSIYFIYIFGGRIRNSEAATSGGGARSAPFGVSMSLKRRVPAAHGRARAAKTHYVVTYIFLKVDSRHLENCFRVFGQIICCKVAVSATGVSLRKGFIQYEKETEAEAAIDVMDQVKIKVRYLFVFLNPNPIRFLDAQQKIFCSL